MSFSAQRFVSRALFLLIGAISVNVASAQFPSERIRLNQVGYYPDGPKLAAVADAPAGSFSVIGAETGEAVYSGELGESRMWTPAGESIRLADFTSLTDEGLYYIDVPGVGQSYPFRIEQNILQEVARGSLKALYFQRVSTPLEPEYAGAWARQAGHPDDEVVVHGSAASAGRPEGTIISAPRGWYDAGDYNKYIVPAAFSSYVMLAGLEHYPEYFEALETDIPESNNGVPDVLDEAVWNLRFMLDMQDPGDGGVYHKLSTANFQGTVQPHVPTATRYVVQKSTTATLDFAAAAAQASRLLRNYESTYPGLADSALTAALDAWDWARSNPNVRYIQQQINQQFDPDINTGEYGDGTSTDELAWAATELYVTTGEDSFHVGINLFTSNSLPGWGSVNMLGYMTLANAELPTAAGAALREQAETRLLSIANQYRTSYQSSPAGIAHGNSNGNYYWGSNGGVGAAGMALMQAYELTGDSSYLDAAISTIDYLLGRNGTGYSYLSAYGMKPMVAPHHRPSGSDKVDMPVPGLLAGGPNPGQQDNCAYTSSLPAKSYVDDYCSYASNEITTYWNVPLLYTAAAAELYAGSVPANDAPPHLLSPMPLRENAPFFTSLAWSATAPFDSYELQVSSSPLFRETEVSHIVEGERELVMLTPERTYYWRVRGIMGGEAGRWSVMSAFSVAPQSPHISAFREDDGMIVMEAESRSGLIEQPGYFWNFLFQRAGSVNRTGYGGPNNGHTFGDSFRAESPMLYYNVRLSTPGTWYPWVRMYSETEDDDELHLGMDGIPFTQGDQLRGGGPYGEWVWVNATASGERSFVQVDEPGLHTLNVWMAEDGVIIDRLLLTNDPAFIPEGEGPPESNVVVGRESHELLPARLTLDAIYPNPFLDVATLSFSTSTASHVRIEVFDVLGRLVTVELDVVLPAGQHQHNIRASKFAAGSYFVQLTAGGGSVAKTITVVK